MEIKVCGLNYQVIEVENFPEVDDRNLIGLCDYEKQEIYIRQSLPSQKKKQVLIHELTHAILNESGYEEQDEDFVNRFSIVLHQVLSDNPKLML